MQLLDCLLHVLWVLSFMLMRLYTYSLSKQLSLTVDGSDVPC